MKIMPYRSVIAGSLLALFLGGACFGDPALTEEWGRTYRGGPADAQVLLCANSDVLIARLITEKDQMEVRRHKKGGEVIWARSLESFGRFEAKGLLRALAEDGDGNIYIGLSPLRGGPLLGKMSAKGEDLWYISLSSRYYNNAVCRISKIVVSEDELFIIGSMGRKMWVCALTPEGAKVREQVYGRKHEVRGVDGVIGANGDLICSADVGMFDKFGGGISSVHLVEYRREGNGFQLLTSFKGKGASLCAVGKDAYAVAYNGESVSLRQEIHIKFLNGKFEERLDRELYKNKACASGVFVRVDNGGRVWMFGVKEFRRVSYVFTSRGELLEEISQDGGLRVISLLDVAMKGDSTVHASACFEMPVGGDVSDLWRTRVQLLSAADNDE